MVIFVCLPAPATAADENDEKQRIAELTAKNLERSQLCAEYRYQRDKSADLSQFTQEQINDCSAGDSDFAAIVGGVILSAGLIIVGTVHLVAGAAFTWANLTGCLPGECGR